MATATRAHRLEPLARALHARLALWYAAAFGMIGVFIPFWPLWLEGRGFTPAEMGVMWAAGTWMRVAVAPLLVNHADRESRDKRPLLRWLGCLAFTCGVLFVPRLGFAGVLAVMVCLASVHSPLISLVDGLTVEAALRLTPHGIRFDYAQVAFRWTFMVDGRPWLAAAITPQNANSGNTLSPFVTLAARAGRPRSPGWSRR